MVVFSSCVYMYRCLWGFCVRLPCSGIADKYFFFLLGLRPLHISCVGVGGLSPISISGVYSGKRSMSAGSSESNFVGFGSEPVYVHLVCVDRSLFLAHLAFRPCELLLSLFVRRPSVNISHFNLLLRNHWTNCNQTLVEWSLDGPLLKLFPVIPTSNQDGRQAQNRKKGG